MNTCIICKTELINEKLLMKARLYNNEPDIFTFEAWCPKCEFYLTKNVQSKNVEEWKLPTINDDDILENFTDQDFKELELSMAKKNKSENSLSYKEWQKFKSLIKPTDEILKYKVPLKNKHFYKYALKREHLIIAVYFDLEV